jgi:tetratricopeptide (TPR) repeat protein
MIERQRPATARAAALSYLPKGEYLKLAVMGYRQLAADIIWLQAVQQFGKRSSTDEEYLWAYHAVDVVTDLDPKFTYAYQAAGTVLGVWGGRPEESIAILKKGMQHNPETWELPFYIAYDYFYEMCDPASAAKYFRMASKLAGAPPYLPRLAARMTVEAGDPDAALEFLYRLYDQVQDDRAREALGLRIREVTAERDIRFLEAGVRQFKLRYGRLPRHPNDLASGGIIKAVPEEPLGGMYELRSDGTVISTGLRERLRVHRRTACQKSGGA